MADDVPPVSFLACDATAMLVVAAAATFLQEDAWHVVVVVACVDRDDSVASQTLPQVVVDPRDDGVAVACA